jgi:hypothetical protein
VRKPEGRRRLERSRRRWKDIEMDFYEMVGGVDWIVLAQDRDRKRAFVDAIMTLQVP